MTFPTDEDEPARGRGRILDHGIRTPRWLYLFIVVAAVGLFLLAFFFDLSEADEAGAAAASIYFLTSGFIAFSFGPGTARMLTLLLGVILGAGMFAGGHGEHIGAWLILGVAALVGVDILSRSVSSVRSTAVTDPLTGLQNRIGLVNETDRAIAICRRLNQPLSLVHIDLDDFKEVNDREGHAQGDKILRLCADSWTGVIRKGDILARIGGDEFLLVLPGSDSDDARRLMGVLKEESPVNWSFGVAELAPGEELQACVDRADAELYTQKAERGQL